VVDSDRAAAAAAQYAVAAKELHCDPSNPVSKFQTTIATRIGGTVVPLPGVAVIMYTPRS
jgi:hypothetical protein